MDIHFTITYNPEILVPDLKQKMTEFLQTEGHTTTFTLHQDRNLPVAMKIDRQDDGPIDELSDFVEALVNYIWTIPREDHETEQGTGESAGGHEPRGTN